MPAPLIGAGISAASGLVGGILQTKAQGKALDAQERANTQAMAFQREQAAKAEEIYKQQWDQWNQGRQALLSRYGITLPESSAPQPPGGAMPRGGPPQGAMPQGAMPQGAMPQGGPAGPPPGVPAGGGSGMTLEEIMQRKGGDPFSWQNYGLR